MSDDNFDSVKSDQDFETDEDDAGVPDENEMMSSQS